MLMTRYVVWNGTPDDLKTLERAAMRNCTCNDEAIGECSAHRMLVDQKILDHMAFVASRRWRYVQAELDPTSEFF